jgi:hypothetical protein
MDGDRRKFSFLNISSTPVYPKTVYLILAIKKPDTSLPGLIG